MGQILQRIPKLLLGAIVIVAVLLFMVFNDPPTTLCDIQMEVVNKRLASHFYTNKKEGTYNKSVKNAFDFCMESNSPGGCYDMFSRMMYLEKQVLTIPSKCGGHTSTENVRNALEKGLKLIVRIAWGDGPPESSYEKKAWLQPPDLALYCRLKREHQRLMGKKRWKLFRETVMAGLPEAKTLSRKVRWEKSLFSFPCKGML